jgi:hypothetical protein
MTHYTKSYSVHHHDDRCFISIRSTENRVDTFSFDAHDIEPLIHKELSNVWIGSDRISIKINKDKHKGTLRINKGHSTVSYSHSIHDTEKLMAMIEDSYFRIEKSQELQNHSKFPKETKEEKIGEDILKSIDRLISTHNRMLLEQIDIRLKNIEDRSVITEKVFDSEPLDKALPKTDAIFIPKNMGGSLVGQIGTTPTLQSNIDVSKLAKTLKKLKDNEK